MRFLLPASTGELALRPGSASSVEQVVGWLRSTILPKGRVLRGVGVKYSVSVFLFGFGDIPRCHKMIVEGSSSQSGPGVSATNSSELPTE